MCRAFPDSEYYGGSAPDPGHQLTTFLPDTDLAGRCGGQPGSGSHVHHEPIDGIGAQLFPDGLATTTPQHFTVASDPANPRPTRSRPTPNCGWGVHR